MVVPARDELQRVRDDRRLCLRLRREQAGRDASPTAAIIDSQSVKSVEIRGLCIDPHDFDAGKSDNEGVAPRSKARSGISSSIPRAC